MRVYSGRYFSTGVLVSFTASCINTESPFGSSSIATWESIA